MRRSLFALMLILLTFGTAIARAADINCPDYVVQGGIYLVTVTGDATVASVRGVFARKSVYFNPTSLTSSGTTFTGMMGVDVTATPEVKLFVVTLKKADGTKEIVTKNVTVRPGNFPVQRLTLDEKWENLDEKTLERIRYENKVVSALYATETPKRLWTGPFVLPLVGEITGAFGLSRYINGQPRGPHTGLDISAVTGTPVAASNDGKVALVMDMFYSGLSLFIDHGQGLYTMYFHLSEVLVSDGDAVKKGDTVALVGATGRVTGAHLHFGVRLNTNRVNPTDLVNGRF
jgi:murein DD-endopeptidase MepM/ murein hydrolase activator NlpD